VFTAPHVPSGLVEFVHHFQREQFVRHGEIEADEAHRPRAIDGGAQVLGRHVEGEVRQFRPSAARAALCMAGDAECLMGWPKTAQYRVEALISLGPASRQRAAG